MFRAFLCHLLCFSLVLHFGAALHVVFDAPLDDPLSAPLDAPFDVAFVFFLLFLALAVALVAFLFFFPFSSVVMLVSDAGRSMLLALDLGGGMRASSVCNK